MIELNVTRKLTGFDLEFNCRIEKGEIIGLYGDSGAGKTSFLRILAGLMKPDKGTIHVEGRSWFDSENGVNLKAHMRSLGYVFQENALFPHLSVKKNLEFALQKGQSSAIVDKLIEMADLGEYIDRRPQSLSGGQQQRAALARALVRQPALLLLDEPLSALDHDMRVRMQDLILEAQKEFEFTTVLVTHDLSEIFKMCHRVFHIEKGKILDRGTPTEIFSHRRSGGKFSFTGEVIDIVREDVIFIVTVLIGSQIAKVVADEGEASELNIGDRVLVSSKAFNPIIQKI